MSRIIQSLTPNGRSSFETHGRPSSVVWGCGRSQAFSRRKLGLQNPGLQLARPHKGSRCKVITSSSIVANWAVDTFHYLASLPEWLQGTLAATSTLFWGSYTYNQARDQLVYNRLESGYCPPPSVARGNGPFLFRDEPAEALSRILTPAEGSVSALFYYVAGPPGGGKTTLVQHMCNEVKQGVVYVSAGLKPSLFGNRLAEALVLIDKVPNPAYLIYDYVTKLSAKDSSSEGFTKLDIALEALDLAAAQYKRKHKKPAVLVIDDAGYLSDQPFFQDLLYAAKTWADAGTLRCVFVSSDDQFVQMISEQSRCSRSGSYELPDLYDREAKLYLTSRGISNSAASQIVECAGGRFMELVGAVEAVQHGTTVADIRKLILAAAEAEFQAAGFLDESPYRANAVELINELLNAGEDGITTEDWNRIVPNPEVKAAFLKTNIFAKRHGGNGGLMFESRAVHNYASVKFGNGTARQTRKLAYSSLGIESRSSIDDYA